MGTFRTSAPAALAAFIMGALLCGTGSSLVAAQPPDAPGPVAGQPGTSSTACKYEANCDCPVPGIPIRWKAAYCMYLNQTDDLEQGGVSACLYQRDPAVLAGTDACAQNAHWKGQLCLARHGQDPDAVRACVADPAMMPSIVEFGPGARHDPREPPPGELAWVGLFNGELVAWLENENRMSELCTAREGSAEYWACREAHLEPKVLVVPVRSAPAAGASRLGEIVILALPGRGLKAVASTGRISTPFTPDLFDVDWGYGPPYFHQTVLARAAAWVRVPVPSMGAGWIDTGFSERGSDLLRPAEGEIVVTPRGDMVVLGVDEGVLRVRPEQPADLWCEAGDPPPLEPSAEVRIPFAELFDAGGHLRIRPKYTRGC